MNARLKTKKIIHVDHAIASILDACCKVSTLKEFERLISVYVKAVLPHDMFIGSMVDLWKNSVIDYIPINFPALYIKSVLAETGILKSPLIRCWKKKYRPFYVNDIDAISSIDPIWCEVAKKNGLENVVVHGVVDISGRYSSYFVFANSSSGWDNRSCYRLELILPNLHSALKRVLYNELRQRAEQQHLSLREVEIIQHIHNGSTNKQIGLILGISDNTVRNHICRTFEKLGVKNRAQAVAKAMDFQLIQT